jgi:putative NADPH-quinone reductase
MTRITIIDGHPDAAHPHFIHALADAYAQGAEEAGHQARRVTVGVLDFPLSCALKRSGRRARSRPTSQRRRRRSPGPSIS